MAKPQKLTRDVVEYAFSDIQIGVVPRSRKRELKDKLRYQRNHELGRKLKRCINSLFSVVESIALAEYFRRRPAYDNTVITMILILAEDQPNALLKTLSDLSGPFTAKQIEAILDRPAITDVNRRLNDFVRGHSDNIILHLPSDRRIQLRKERSEKGLALLWMAHIFDASQWMIKKVNIIIFRYPQKFRIKRFIVTTPSISNAIVNYTPKMFYAEGTDGALDIYFVHDEYVSHSRYLVDRYGISKIFELRSLQDGNV